MAHTLDETMARLAARTRSTLLRKIRARIGPAVARRIEAEDVLQQAYVNAIPHFRRQPVPDRAGFVRWILHFATNEIRSTSRRRQARRSETDDLASQAPQRGLALRLRSERGRGGTLDQERALALRDNFLVPWESVSFLLARPSPSATRKLLQRARRHVLRTPAEPLE